MARRMFAVVDVVELLRHWQAGDSLSQMARALGLDRKTVRKYTGRAEAAGLVPGGSHLSQAEWAAKVREWFPELKRSTCEILGARPDRDPPHLHPEAPRHHHARHYPSAPARRARPHGEHRQPAPLRAPRVRRRGGREPGHGAARRSPAGRGGAARLRTPGQLDRPPERREAARVGVHHDARLLPPSVLLPRAAHDARRVPRRPRGRLRLLRRLPASPRARQPGQRHPQGPTCTTRGSIVATPSSPTTTAASSTRRAWRTPKTRLAHQTAPRS
jgi:hypothetical protein